MRMKCLLCHANEHINFMHFTQSLYIIKCLMQFKTQKTDDAEQ